MPHADALRAWIPIFLIAVLGCSPGAQPTVRGEVTFAGEAVEPGSIVFLPEPGTESRKAAAAIVAGRYQIPAERSPSPGVFRVEISWSKKTGKRIHSADPGMMIDETIEAIPAKFNRDSILKVEITRGENVHHFKLKPD